MISLKLEDQTLITENLGSNGMFTAIIVALVAVRVQKFFTGQKSGHQDAGQRAGRGL